MTVAARAASARRRRLRDGAVVSPETSVAAGPRDPCPLCRAELAGSDGTSRRLAVLAGAVGTFAWRCPDCRNSWTERAATPIGRPPPPR